MLLKWCIQYVNKFTELRSSHRTGKDVFIPIPRKGNAKECSNYHTIALISQASKVMLKILQAKLQQYINQELPNVQAGFRKCRGTRDQIANIHWIMEKAKTFQKNIYLCCINCAKAFYCVDHNKLWEILKEMGVPDHFPWLLRKLYAGQGATVRIRYGTTDFSILEKECDKTIDCHSACLTYIQSYCCLFIKLCPTLLWPHGL